MLELNTVVRMVLQKEFRKDVHLVFENCFLYNPETPDRRNFEVTLISSRTQTYDNS